MLSRAAQASSFGPSTDSAVGEFDSKVVVITGSGRGVGRGHRGGPCARGRADRSRRFLCAANSKAIAEDNGTTSDGRGRRAAHVHERAFPCACQLGKALDGNLAHRRLIFPKAPRAWCPVESGLALRCMKAAGSIPRGPRLDNTNLRCCLQCCAYG